MLITRYRFIAVVYPHESMEAEVKDGDKTYYVNIDVNTKGEPTTLLEDGWWSYTTPLDEVEDFEDSSETIDIDFSDVLQQMVDKWNAYPVFGAPHGYKGPWRAWEYDDRACAETFKDPVVKSEMIEDTGGGFDCLTYEIDVIENGKPSILYAFCAPETEDVVFMRATPCEAFPTFGDEEWCDVPGCLDEMPAFSEICRELKERTILMDEGTYTRKYPERVPLYGQDETYSPNACPDKKYRDVFAIRREGKTILYGTPTDGNSLDRIEEIAPPNSRQDTTQPAYPSEITSLSPEI